MGGDFAKRFDLLFFPRLASAQFHGEGRRDHGRRFDCRFCVEEEDAPSTCQNVLDCACHLLPGSPANFFGAQVSG